MRKNTIILIFTLGLFSIYSCDKENPRTYISGTPSTPEFLGPDSPDGMTFTKDSAENSIDFTWTVSDFGFQASVTYGAQISLTSDFAKSATLFTKQGLEGSAKVSDIDNVLISWNLPVNIPVTINCRIFAMVSPNADTAFSATKEYTVTPYETLLDYPMVYVPGDYQNPVWAPGGPIGRLYSYKFNNTYEGILRMDDADGNGTIEFKLTNAPDWNHTNWGGTMTNGSAILNPSGGNYKILPGTYAVTADVIALTVKMTVTNDWGIIGTSIPPYDWSEDLNLEYNGQRQMWVITADFKAGVFKFRANDGWDDNFGSDNADGTLSAGGKDISIAADGNYTIRLDTKKPGYQLIKN